ncbi:MAG: sugar ABC transporter permease [Thermomicrobiales bacterium]|nr:sugar ABC transporter permease [Thermomicrobiales bacterium]
MQQSGNLPRLNEEALIVEKPTRTVWQRLGREEVIFLLFVFPNLFLFAVFTFWPMARAFYLSGVRWDMISPTKRWVGLANYEYLFNNDAFRKTLVASLYYTVGTIGGTLILGLLAALLLNLPLRGRDGVRAAVFAPNLLSGAAISIIWVYMFDPRYGIIKEILGWFGASSPNWLRDPDWAMPAVIVVSIWRTLGFATVIYLAGLQAIPKDLYEAAKVDGAGAFWRFRSVTIPMLSPILFFLMVTSVLSSFQSFDIIRVMTQGGPVDSTSTLIWYIYEQGFIAMNAGRSAAATVILFLFLLVFTLFQVNYSERKVHYGS